MAFYEMHYKPSFGGLPAAFQGGWLVQNCSAKPQPTLQQAVERMAAIVNGKIAGLEFWNPAGRALAEQMSGMLAVLDVESYYENLYAACKLFRKKAGAKAPVTTYGFLWARGSFSPTNEWKLVDTLLDYPTSKFRDYLKSLRPYLPDVSMIDVSIYLGHDNSKPVDRDRDCRRNLLLFERLVDVARITFPREPLVAIIRPRMMYGPEPLQHAWPIPDQWVPDYVEIAKRCDHQMLFEAETASAKMIELLKAK